MISVRDDLGRRIQISAVRNSRIYILTCDTICRPGPRLADGMERLQTYLNSF